MNPAAQGFDAHDLLGAVVDDRLISDLQLVSLDRYAQIVLDQLALEQIGIHVDVVDAGAVAALILGPIERHVGVTHDVGRVADILADHRDADGGADHDRLVVDGVGRAERRDQSIGDHLQRCRVASRRSDDAEFIAANAGDKVVAAQRAGQPLRDGADELVADRMAERVIDVLEVVEVDVENGGRRATAAYLLDGLLEPLSE